MKRFTPEQVSRMCAQKNVGTRRRSVAKRLAHHLGEQHACRFKPYLCPICGLYHLTRVREEATNAA